MFSCVDVVTVAEVPVNPLTVLVPQSLFTHRLFHKPFFLLAVGRRRPWMALRRYVTCHTETCGRRVRGRRLPEAWLETGRHRGENDGGVLSFSTSQLGAWPFTVETEPRRRSRVGFILINTQTSDCRWIRFDVGSLLETRMCVCVCGVQFHSAAVT